MGQESLDTLRKLDCRPEQLLTLLGLGITYFFLNRGEAAIETSQEFHELAVELEDDWWTAVSLSSSASASLTAQVLKDARHYAEQAIREWERIGDRWGVIWPGTVLARLAAMEGNYVEEQERYQFVLEAAESINFKRGLQYTLSSLGYVKFRLGNYSEAEDYYFQSLGISDETGQTREMLATLYDLAQLRAAEGREGEAVELLAIILQHPGKFQHGLFRQAAIEESAQALRRELEDRLAPETYRAAWMRGSDRDLQNAVDELLASGFPQNE